MLVKGVLLERTWKDRIRKKVSAYEKLCGF